MNYTLPQLFKIMIDQGGSDLHIAAGSPPRIRLDGRVLPLNLPPLSGDDSANLCLSILSEEQRNNLEVEMEIDLSFSVENLARIRANIYYESDAVSGSFRAIPMKITSLNDLGLPKILGNFCKLRRGLVLVTGPTGSGKSTTLAAIIDRINEARYDHIVTIEDPIEFIHNHKNCLVTQREIGADTHSMSNAIKSVLRQDPDVILIGEMRDLDTIASALTLAETGHLVFATLHTNNAVSSINRIVDVFPPGQQDQIKTQLSMTIEAVISQNLIPCIHGGRALAIEIMVAQSGIRALINEGKINQVYSAIQSGQEGSGMITMNQSLLELMRQNKITREQVLSYSPNPSEIIDFITKSQQPPKVRR